MIVSIDDIAVRSESLMNCTLPREEVASWASAPMAAHDAGEIRCEPRVHEARIWDAIRYLAGLELKDSPTSYLQGVDDLRRFYERWKEPGETDDAASARPPSARFEDLLERRVQSWSAREMALREGEPQLESVTFHDPSVPFLQLGILHIALANGGILAVTTTQFDAVWGLTIAPATSALQPTQPDGIYRNRRLDELANALVTRVKVHTDGSGRIEQVDLDLDDDSEIALVAGEAYEERDGRLRFLRDDESILLFPRRTDLAEIEWQESAATRRESVWEKVVDTVPEDVQALAEAWCRARPFLGTPESMRIRHSRRVFGITDI